MDTNQVAAEKNITAHDTAMRKDWEGNPLTREVVKVAIVGGGCAGVAAAWELSRLNDDATHPARYEITLYEKSWRLGGKGASGRDASGRIREHGLHIWLGFYENAFRMIRDCYRVVEADHNGRGDRKGKGTLQPLPHATFEDAFFPEPHVGVAAKNRSGRWETWTGMLPPMKGLPGDPLDSDTNPFTLAGYLARCIGLSRALMLSVLGQVSDDPAPGQPRANERSAFDEAADLDFSRGPGVSASVFVERMAQLLRVSALTTAAGILQGATIVENWLRTKNPAGPLNLSILTFLEALATQTRKQLRDFVDADEHVRRKTEIIDLIMTIMVGLYRDKVLFDARGLDAINHIDCKKWLRDHGALDSSVDSPFVTGLYDLAFCYEEGDRNKPALAAGQALRGALRMFFTYRGSLFWRMRSGMGDAVFAPLYRVLRQRGVTFCFMHELSKVEFNRANDESELLAEALHFELNLPAAALRQVNEKPLDAELGCWPHDRPAQFGNLKPLKKARSFVVRRVDRNNEASTQGFHAVVLAMGVVDFAAICGGLLDDKRGKPWREMCEKVKTIGTQSAQVWLKKDLLELGWLRGSVLVSACEGPLETWADMTHVLPTERAWRTRRGGATTHDDGARSVVYFCGPLSDKTIEQVRPEADKVTGLKAHVAGNLHDLLADQIKPFWPRAFRRDEDGKVETAESLIAASGKPGSGFDGRHVQANWCGSDRYTLALPGTLEYRISPLDRSVANMTIAGDWTECGFNEGCVESAVMSGMLAAHALSGKPDLDDIIGYNHP